MLLEAGDIYEVVLWLVEMQRLFRHSVLLAAKHGRYKEKRKSNLIRTLTLLYFQCNQSDAACLYFTLSICSTYQYLALIEVLYQPNVLTNGGKGIKYHH